MDFALLLKVPTTEDVYRLVTHLRNRRIFEPPPGEVEMLNSIQTFAAGMTYSRTGRYDASPEEVEESLRILYAAARCHRTEL